jgi:hypothetical protein
MCPTEGPLPQELPGVMTRPLEWVTDKQLSLKQLCKVIPTTDGGPMEDGLLL